MRNRFQLDSAISRITGSTKLWQTERGVIKVNEDTLAIPIKLGDELRGYVFHGQGKLLLDAIVETDEGAAGKSVEKEINEPFLMLGQTQETSQLLIAASQEDLIKMGYGNQQEFFARAEGLLNRFFEEGRMNNHQSLSKDHGSVFAFQNRTRKLDILVSRGSKLVYKTADLVFVSDENRVVLKSSGEVICSSNRRAVIIKR